MPAPSARQAPGGMEPGPRRRRRRHSCRPPVSVFLRDPNSGRVYRRGKLIGKVRPPRHHECAARVRGRAGVPAGRGGVCARDREPRRAPGFSSCVCRVSARVWGLALGLRGLRGRVCGVAPAPRALWREPLFGVLCGARGSAVCPGLWVSARVLPGSVPPQELCRVVSRRASECASASACVHMLYCGPLAGCFQIWIRLGTRACAFLHARGGCLCGSEGVSCVSVRLLLSVCLCT